MDLQEVIAKLIYEGICTEGIKASFNGVPFEELPQETHDAYRRIAITIHGTVVSSVKFPDFRLVLVGE